MENIKKKYLALIKKDFDSIKIKSNYENDFEKLADKIGQLGAALEKLTDKRIVEMNIEIQSLDNSKHSKKDIERHLAEFMKQVHSIIEKKYQDI